MDVNGVNNLDQGDRPTKEEDSVDGILNHDRDDLVDRVAYLEGKVRQHSDTVVCLKSALADCLRRVAYLESTSSNQNATSSRASNRPSAPRPRSSMGGPSMRPHLNALDNVNVMSHRNAPNTTRSTRSSSTRLSTASSLSKWSSLSTSAEMSNTALTPSSSKEPQWNAGDGCMKMYMRGRGLNLYAPSDVTEFNPGKPNDPPSEKLQLEWVYGYRGRDCRANLYYLPTGEMVYFTAAVVILHNLEEQTQRHYLGHTDDIKCIAIHPDRVKIASGQVAGHDSKEGKDCRRSRLVSWTLQDVLYKEVRKKPPTGTSSTDDKLPHVRIWDSVSLHTLQVIGLGYFNRAVCCLSFSKLDGGNQLVAVDEANDHVLSVWDVSKDKPSKITETKSSTDPVLCVEFHPSEKNHIISCGKNAITFWTLEGGTLSKKQGIFDKHEKPKYMLCLAFTDNGDILTGDSNGTIFVWAKGANRISQAMVGAHEGGVFSICVMSDGTILSGGGKDRKIIQWDSSYQRTSSVAEVPDAYGPVRTLSQGKGGLILVGTTRNCILHGSLDLELTVAVQGHIDELWGLATHPGQHQFLTCGSDKQIYLWDSQSRSAVWTKEMNDSIHSCCFHPNGAIIAVGTNVARWLVLDVATREMVSVHTDGSEQIECMAYSPDGALLALGSRDNFIYVYQVFDDGKKYSKIGKCAGHSSFITHVDWSTDSQYLVSNSGDYEVLYWTASSCKQMTNVGVIKELKWATQSCVFTFNTAGIWPEGADGTDINGCTKSHNSSLLATADDFGKVNLFTYPCSQPKSNCHSQKGHSSHVTSVDFLFDDSRLISTGGKDASVMQWQVVG